jgi:Fur family ferric uptake transcriptional regulator
MNSKKSSIIQSSFDSKSSSKGPRYRLPKLGADSISHVSKEIKAIFRRRGFKCTPQRLAVLGILGESIRHLSINEVHKGVKRILPRTGLATIYRTLETLEKLGLVVRVHLEDGCQSYMVAPVGHHHPIVCVGCNRVVDFADCPIEDLSRRLSRKTGFTIKQHFLQLSGKCRECQTL